MNCEFTKSNRKCEPHFFVSSLGSKIVYWHKELKSRPIILLALWHSLSSKYWPRISIYISVCLSDSFGDTVEHTNHLQLDTFYRGIVDYGWSLFCCTKSHLNSARLKNLGELWGGTAFAHSLRWGGLFSRCAYFDETLCIWR